MSRTFNRLAGWAWELTRDHPNRTLKLKHHGRFALRVRWLSQKVWPVGRASR